MSEAAAGQGRRKAALAFIFVTVTLDIVGLGLTIPVLPELIKEFAGSTAQAASVTGVFVGVWALMQFLFSPVMGALSDRFGRRPVILSSNLGLGLDYMLMAVAPSLWWLFVGRLISGMMAACVSTSFAYIADVTEPEKRAGAYGMVGAAFGLGFILGPALGGLLGDVDPRLPFWVAACLTLVNAAYGLFILPESLPPEKRSDFSWTRANPIGAFGLLNSNRRLIRLALVNFTAQFAHYVLPTVFVLYVGERYGWTPKTVGLTMAGIGVCAAFVQGWLTARMVKRFGERKTLLAALVFGAAGFAIYAFAPTGWLFLLGVPVMSLWGMAGPTTLSLMTSLVSPGEQGRLQGATMSLGSVAGFAAPFVFGGVFSLFVGRWGVIGLPGAPFLVAAALLLTAAALAWRAALKETQVDRA